jgi:hypothetical protein
MAFLTRELVSSNIQPMHTCHGKRLRHFGAELLHVLCSVCNAHSAWRHVVRLKHRQNSLPDSRVYTTRLDEVLWALQALQEGRHCLCRHAAAAEGSQAFSIFLERLQSNTENARQIACLTSDCAMKVRNRICKGMHHIQEGTEPRQNSAPAAGWQQTSGKQVAMGQIHGG